MFEKFKERTFRASSGSDGDTANNRRKSSNDLNGLPGRSSRIPPMSCHALKIGVVVSRKALWYGSSKIALWSSDSGFFWHRVLHQQSKPGIIVSCASKALNARVDGISGACAWEKVLEPREFRRVEQCFPSHAVPESHGIVTSENCWKS